MENDLEERSSLDSIMEYLQILWHWAWLLLLAAGIAGGVAYYLTNQQTRMYQSTTLVQVNGATTSSSIDTSTSLYYGQQLTATYSNTMLTGPVMAAVSTKVGFPVSASQINVQAVSNTALLKITVTSDDPNKAALIANTIISVFSSQVLMDQTSRYSDLKTSLEKEISTIDDQIAGIQEKLSVLNVKLNAESATQLSLDPTKQTSLNSTDLLTQSQYNNSLLQYQQSRAYIVQTYEQLKLAEAQASSSLIQKDPAVPNVIPVEPQPLKSAILAALVGFMLAAGVIFLIAILEDEIRDPEEITRKWGIPVLGLITSYKENSAGIITMAQPRAPVSEAFRSLRTNLQFSSVDNPLRTILITSASPADGKTSVVANLATVMAQNNKEVVVVDGDLRRPRIHKVFALSNRLGLSDYFIRKPEYLKGVIKTTGTKGLSVITSGSLPPNPSELLSSAKMLEVIKVLGTHFDTIILDTPPLLAVTDALVLAPRMDGVVLVMDPTKTKRGALRHAIEQLQRVNAPLLGVVLNNVKVKRSQYYYNRNYYYGKQYGRLEEVVDEPTSSSVDLKS
jgi:non-specific protein-tyrosine kinase